MKLKPHPGIYGIITMLILWQALAYYVDNEAAFPSVTALLEKLFHMLLSADFYTALGITIVRGLIGFVLAIAITSILAAIALHNSFFKLFFQPINVIMRSIPVISLVLIALLIIAPPNLPVFIAFITMFPILYQNILSGLEHTDIKLVEKAKVLRKSNFERFRLIYFPSARQLIFAGIATAMGFGWRAVIIGEVLAAPFRGIGTNMKKAQAMIDVTELLAWTVVAVAVSFLFDFILKQISKINNKPKSINIKKLHAEISSINTDFKLLNISDLDIQLNNKTIIKDFSKTLSNHNINLLKGFSGSGKSTIMNFIAGLIKEDNGNINYNIPHPVVSYLFQDKRLIPWLNIEQNLAFPLSSFPTIYQNDYDRIELLLNMLELIEHRYKYPEELSGGEAQRVALAVALMINCDILLLDEPLTGMELTLRTKIIDIIIQWTESYKPIIIWATHDDIQEYLTSGYSEIVLN